MSQCTPQKLTPKSCARFCRAIKPENGFQIITATLPAARAEYAAKTAYKETDATTYQAMEALVHNLNTMNSRAGAQVPFSSLNYGTDTSPEGRMAVHNLLRATEAGLGDGETPIFPVQIFKVKEGVNYNEGDPNYDLFRHALRCSAKRLFPNFSFLDCPVPTCNTISPAIITPRWHTWVAVRASWAMYSITQRKSPAAEAI